MPSEIVTMTGHILDTGILPAVLDELGELEVEYEIVELKVGKTRESESLCRMEITSDTDEQLLVIIDRLRAHGANAETVEDATLEDADIAGSFPPGFYSTTNLETEVRVDGKWIRVERPEMDCGIVLDEKGARTIAMSDVSTGMKIVMRGLGIRVIPLKAPPAGEGRAAFEFMSSDVSSEKPKALLVERVAQQLRDVKAKDGRVLWVAGPAVVHTGSAPDLCALVRGGFVDALFAGNGVAAHDIESNMYGTSLGVYLNQGLPAEHGHEHHIRAINEVRRLGSFRATIDAGVLKAGLVHDLVKADADYLFGGSVRDDGPLPEVVTDMIEVQRQLRDIIWGKNGKAPISFCIVIGTMLHGIATGNCLPASVPLVCVDINQATVTKLMDRGSWQSVGIITDVGLFIRELAERLTPEEMRSVESEASVREAGSRTRS
jgi:lysine-ketoglutarate reductase/saccharopine dehydrogenase-like protein (TIGR00300 family)